MALSKQALKNNAYLSMQLAVAYRHDGYHIAHGNVLYSPEYQQFVVERTMDAILTTPTIIMHVSDCGSVSLASEQPTVAKFSMQTRVLEKYCIMDALYSDLLYHPIIKFVGELANLNEDWHHWICIGDYAIRFVWDTRCIDSIVELDETMFDSIEFVTKDNLLPLRFECPVNLTPQTQSLITKLINEMPMSYISKILLGHEN